MTHNLGPRDALLRILACPNVASKEVIIRQYDHEVQGGSVIKPLVGLNQDGPSDAAVLRPCLDATEGIALSSGINPYLGDLDTWSMAASAIDEAVRNCVAVGADPARIALLDNFCWGNTEQPETLGSLVRAALACHDTAIKLVTPFISGKDSLNNEFSYQESDGTSATIAIPPTLLISALGWIPDVRRCVTMDLKQPGNHLYLVGTTRDEMGGSHWNLVNSVGRSGTPPSLHAEVAKAMYQAVHRTMRRGLVQACHDLSEGGLAVAAAEMAFAGGLGIVMDLHRLPVDAPTPFLPAEVLLFSESNSRLLCEVAPQDVEGWEAEMRGIPWARVGTVSLDPRLIIRESTDTRENALIDLPIEELRQSWKRTLRK